MKQYLQSQHSWGIVGQNIARSLRDDYHHEVDLCTTNLSNTPTVGPFPIDLLPNLKCKNCSEKIRSRPCLLGSNYDMSIAYTAMHNWRDYFSQAKKNRFGIWNYDGTHIPPGWAKFYKFVDLVLPSSEYSKTTFIRNGIPAEVIRVIPHGAAEEFFSRQNVYNIDMDRKYKFFVNIAQPHTRKNIPGLLDVWGKSFTNRDDVVLVAKVAIKENEKKMPFEVSWIDELLKMKKRYRTHAPVLVVNDFIPYISDLYRSCNIGLSLSHVECFNMPALESMIVGNITIASNYGGSVDFMNTNNSLLVNGKIGRAPDNCQYWIPNVYGEMFFPDTNHAVETLQRVVKEYDALKEQFAPGIEKIRQEYTWKSVVGKILELAR